LAHGAACAFPVGEVAAGAEAGDGSHFVSRTASIPFARRRLASARFSSASSRYADLDESSPHLTMNALPSWSRVSDAGVFAFADVMRLRNEPMSVVVFMTASLRAHIA